jgi:hypothetical protein
VLRTTALGIAWSKGTEIVTLKVRKNEEIYYDLAQFFLASSFNPQDKIYVLMNGEF